MNEAAKALIHELRTDEHTRKHFDMSNWRSATCSTVGCIAGTALLRAGLYEEVYAARHTKDIASAAKELLGIPFMETACHLFVPWDMLPELLSRPMALFEYLPQQARPSLETIEQMKAWAGVRQHFSVLATAESYTPDRAAYALERIVKDEVPYCNWAEAFEKA